MELLLLGGAGYIGSHTAIELLEAGHQVTIADSYSNSSPRVTERIRRITGRSVKAVKLDGADKGALEGLFRENNFDAVVHFAAYKAVGESVREPLKYYRNNLDVTLTLLETMERHGVARLVFSSSATVYGVPERLPLTEDMPLSATNPYGQTKITSERILEDVCSAWPELGVCSLRYFNPVGAHPSGLIGEEPRGVPNNLMPYLMQVATGRRQVLHIYGDDYPTKDGTGVRDYIHVMDLAKGHVSALRYIGEKRGFYVFNLGTGAPVSVLELVEAFGRACGRKIPYVIDPRRPGDVAQCYADPGKARRELKWQSEKTLDDMCADAWRWQQTLEREKDTGIF